MDESCFAIQLCIIDDSLDLIITIMREPQLHRIIALTKLKRKTYKRMKQTLFKAKIELFQNVINRCQKYLQMAQ